MSAGVELLIDGDLMLEKLLSNRDVGEIGFYPF